MNQRPLEVDQIARGVWNKAAIAIGMNDTEAALEVCRELAAIEDQYELKLRVDRPSPSAGARFVGRPINAQFSGVCRVCGRPYKAGADVLWTRGGGTAHLACGEVEL